MRKYRVHELGKFRYSDIREYVDENHTDRPLRNDELVDLLNNKKHTINKMAKTIRIYDDGYIDLNKKYKKVVDENEQLKDFIRKISTNNEIILANGTIYKIDKVIK